MEPAHANGWAGRGQLPTISEEELWSQIVGGPYKAHIYEMEAYYFGGGMSSASMTGSLALDEEVQDCVCSICQTSGLCTMFPRVGVVLPKGVECHEGKLQKNAKKNKKIFKKMCTFFQKMEASQSSGASLSPVLEDSSDSFNSVSDFNDDDVDAMDYH